LGLGVLFALYFIVLPASNSTGLMLIIGLPTLAILAILSSFLLPATVIEVLALAYLVLSSLNKTNRVAMQTFVTNPWFWCTILISAVAVAILLFNLPEMIKQLKWFVEGFV
jgi:hypothetical protein